MGQPPVDRERSVLTMLFTDIVGSTELLAGMGDDEWSRVLEAHDAVVREALQQFDGREVKTVGDGFVAVFSRPGLAVQCAQAVVAGTQEIGVPVRVGLHCGEVEVRGHDVVGVGVHVAARVAALARSGEVLISDTVRDLVAGGGFSFQPRGTRTLKGVPGRRKLFAVEHSSSPPAAAEPAPPARTSSKPAKRPAKAAAGKAATKTPKRSSNAPAVRLVLADDHPLWRKTLRGLLEHDGACEVVAEAGDGREVVDLVAEHVPDVVVMDVDMPEFDGIRATAQVVDLNDAKVLILSAVKEREQVLAAVRAGARGYMLKTAGGSDIADAVRRIHGGEVVFPPELTPLVLAELRKTAAAVPSNGIRVALAAARVVDREGLGTLLSEEGFEVVFKGVDPAAAMSAVDRGEADVAVLDTDDANATPAARAHLLVLADELDPSMILEQGDLSGGGYVLKKQLDRPSVLSDAVRRVASGEVVLDPEFVSQLLEAKRAPRTSPLDALSQRETEVLASMAEGHSNQSIADRLHLGTKTVEGHIAAIFGKLGLEATPHDHRRVKAVVTYLESAGSP